MDKVTKAVRNQARSAGFVGKLSKKQNITTLTGPGLKMIDDGLDAKSSTYLSWKTHAAGFRQKMMEESSGYPYPRY